MRHFKNTIIFLLCLCFSGPSFAQTPTNEELQKAVEKRQKNMHEIKDILALLKKSYGLLLSDITNKELGEKLLQDSIIFVELTGDLEDNFKNSDTRNTSIKTSSREDIWNEPEKFRLQVKNIQEAALSNAFFVGHLSRQNFDGLPPNDIPAIKKHSQEFFTAAFASCKSCHTEFKK